MQKLLVLFPFYRQLPVSWFFNWLKMEKAPLVGHLETDGAYLPLALTQMVQAALADYPDWDRLVIFEQDMVPPADAFNRIATYGYEHDIVGCLYFGHDWPYYPNVAMQVAYPNFSPLTREAVRLMRESPGLYEVDGVSTGFTSIARHVLEDWDPDIEMWMPQPPFIAHDMHFMHHAKKQGYKVFVDSGIGCGHLTEMPITYPDSQKALTEHPPLTWQQALEEGGSSIPEWAPTIKKFEGQPVGAVIEAVSRVPAWAGLAGIQNNLGGTYSE